MHLVFWLFPVNILGFKSVSKHTYTCAGPFPAGRQCPVLTFRLRSRASVAPLRRRFLCPSRGPSAAPASRAVWPRVDLRSSAGLLLVLTVSTVFPASAALPTPDTHALSSKRPALGVQLPPSRLTGLHLGLLDLRLGKCLLLLTLFLWSLKRFFRPCVHSVTTWQEAEMTGFSHSLAAVQSDWQMALSWRSIHCSE